MTHIYYGLFLVMVFFITFCFTIAAIIGNQL